MQVHTLVNPTPEQFLEAQRLVQPNFFYIQGQQLEDEEIGSLVWGDADMSDPQSFVCLISPPFPTIVSAEIFSQLSAMLFIPWLSGGGKFQVAVLLAVDGIEFLVA